MCAIGDVARMAGMTLPAYQRDNGNASYGLERAHPYSLTPSP